MEKRGFLLHQTLESVSAALTSNRIRLTCVDVSHQYILLGANTGSVYVFERETTKFIQLLSIDAMRDPVALLRFSPDEKYLALVNNKSRAIFVMEFALKIRRSEKVRSLPVNPFRAFLCVYNISILAPVSVGRPF
jgi:WD40 repeat protein